MRVKEITAEKKRKRIGLEIKKARRYKNITQEELAKNVNLSRTYLSDIENGRYMPSVKTLTALAVSLEMDLNFLAKDGNTSKII